MNPTLASSLEWTLPESVGWFGVYAGFLGLGCGLICLLGLTLLVREAWAAWQSGFDGPSTFHAEFMGCGIAKERYRPAKPSRPVEVRAIESESTTAFPAAAVHGPAA